MRTNISKFTTSLADFSWPTNAPVFPNQQDVYQYLVNYVDQFLPKNIFQLNTQVINVSYSNDQWLIEYRTKSNEILSQLFDFVIIASGFFNCPHIPTNIANLSAFPGTLLHSSDYRSPDQVQNRRVIIVGGSMSAAEIVADMAPSAEHIIHIVPNNFWSIPRFIPLIPNDPASPFLPVDLVFYRRSKRTTPNEIIIRSADENKKSHGFFRLITGDTQESSKLNDTNDENPTFVAISDMYAEWVRAEKITLQQGRLIKIENDGTLG